MARQVVLEGLGLHSGQHTRVTLRAREGLVCLSGKGWRAEVKDLEVVSTARATTVRPRGGGEPIGTVEHAFAAFAGLGVYEGVEVFVEGPEMPLLDGGASRWCEAVASLSPPRSEPPIRVGRPLSLEVGPSRYGFSPGAGVDVEVSFELDDPRVATTARWQGDPADFVRRIAPARTFAMASEVEQLLRRGLARHVDPASVVLLAPDAIHHAGRPFEADEPARHKLLDLIGDLYVRGGPPIGRVRAHRPGHAANARAVDRALEEAALIPVS